MDIPESFHEVYEVEKTVDLYNKGGHYRIEVVRVAKGGSSEEYAAHYYREVDGVWRVHEAPWVATNDATEALHQAMHWLAMREPK